MTWSFVPENWLLVLVAFEKSQGLIIPIYSRSGQFSRLFRLIAIRSISKGQPEDHIRIILFTILKSKNSGFQAYLDIVDNKMYDRELSIWSTSKIFN